MEGGDENKMRLKLPSAAKLRDLLHKTPLPFLSEKQQQSQHHQHSSQSGNTHYYHHHTFNTHTEDDSRSFLSVPVDQSRHGLTSTSDGKSRSRAVSSASDNSFSSLTRWASSLSLSVSLKTTSDVLDRVLGETESGVAFNESENASPSSSSPAVPASDEETAYSDALHMDPSKCLPLEIMVNVLGYLDDKSLLTCGTISKRWSELANSNAVWRQLYFQNQWQVSEDLPPGAADWKLIYKTRYKLEQRWKHPEVDPKVLVGHSDSVYCVQFDDKKVVTGSRDRTIRVWNSKTGQLTKTMGYSINDEAPPPPSPSSTASALSASSPSQVTAASSTTSTSPDAIYHSGSVLCLSYDEELMVSGSSDSSCIIWDMSKLRPIKQVYRHSAGVLDVSLDKNYIVSCSKDSTICVWDRTDSSKYPIKWRLKGHRGPVNAVELQGDYIVSAGGDATVKLWSASTGNLIRQFHGHIRGLACVQICLKSRRIVSGSNDNTIRVWDLDSGRCIYVLEGHKALVRSVHLFNDRIISGSYDQTIKVWNLHTGELVCDIDGLHGSWIFSAKADVKRIITTSIGIKPVIMNFGKDLDPTILDYIR